MLAEDNSICYSLTRMTQVSHMQARSVEKFTSETFPLVSGMLWRPWNLTTDTLWTSADSWEPFRIFCSIITTILNQRNQMTNWVMMHNHPPAHSCESDSCRIMSTNRWSMDCDHYGNYENKTWETRLNEIWDQMLRGTGVWWGYVVNEEMGHQHCAKISQYSIMI